MVWVIAFSSPDSSVIGPQSLCVKPHSHLLKFVSLDRSCYRDKVNRAAGQRAVVMVFAESLRQFYRDGTNPAHLSGLSRQDSSIWTRKLASIYLDFAKTHANPDTDGNFPYHRAVSKNTRGETVHSAARSASNFVFRDKTVFHRLSIYTATRHLCLLNSVSALKFIYHDSSLRRPHKPANAHIKNCPPATFC